MRVFDVKICERGRLTCYICDESPEMPDVVRDAMLVFPGGGYAAYATLSFAFILFSF